MIPVSVFLVEDNVDDEFLAVRTLRKIGIDCVTVARDGEEAVHMLESGAAWHAAEANSHRCILIDLQLPKVNGIEVLRTARTSEHSRDLAIIVLTSSEDPLERETCQKIGVLAILDKPLRASDLCSVLERRD